MRAAIYLRISQDKTGEAAGVERQREDCLALAEELGWQVAEMYPDNDTSATSSKPRENYRRMLSDIEAGRIDAIICWHTDRLYRKLADLEELAALIEARGIPVRTCRAGELDMSTPTGRMLARILGSIAQYEVEQKADRWLRSYRQRREDGRWMASGPRSFGWNRQGEQVPEEVAVLRDAAKRILDGDSARAICIDLQAKGVRTTKGNDWQPSALRQTLRSPRIAGLSVLKGVIVGPGGWDAILERDTWERVVAALDAASITKLPNRRSLLTRRAFCGIEDCGRPLYRSSRGRSTTTRYTCRTETRNNGHVTISAVPLEEMVEAYAQAKLADDLVRRALANRLMTASPAAAKLTKEIDELDGEIRDMEAQVATAGQRSRAALLRSIDDLDGQVKQKRAALATLTPVALPPSLDEWPDDLDRRAALIGLVVERVVVLPADRRGRFDPSRVRIEPVELPAGPAQ